MRHVLLASSFAVLLLGGLGDARADAIGPPPERCPEGSEGAFCHGPPRCAPLSCEIDTDCGAGMRCVERPLCVRDQSCSGGWGGGGPPVPHIDAACPDGTCTGFDTSCQSLKVCVANIDIDGGAPRPDAGSSPSDGGSSPSDGGSTPTDGGGPSDAGGTPRDAGGMPSDAGGTPSDAGGSRADGGGARADGGPAQRDAGSGTTSGGGCCSAVGARSGAGGALFVALIIATGLRRSRRR